MIIVFIMLLVWYLGFILVWAGAMHLVTQLIAALTWKHQNNFLVQIISNIVLIAVGLLLTGGLINVSAWLSKLGNPR